MNAFSFGVDTISLTTHIACFQNKVNKVKLISLDRTSYASYLEYLEYFFEYFLLTLNSKNSENSAFKISLFHNDKGINFYSYRTDIYFSSLYLGHFAYGGNEDTFQMYLNGHFFLYFNKLAITFPHKYTYLLLYYSVFQKFNFSITRLDCFIDDFEGLYSIDYFLNSYKKKSSIFSKRKISTVSYQGDWLNKNCRTLYIGSRNSSKMLRIYEKGCKLKKFEKWLRLEVEFKSRSHKFLIPLTAFLYPYNYIVEFFPILKTTYPPDFFKYSIILEDKDISFDFQKVEKYDLSIEDWIYRPLISQSIEMLQLSLSYVMYFILLFKMKSINRQYSKTLNTMRTIFNDELFLNFLTFDPSNFIKEFDLFLKE